MKNNDKEIQQIKKAMEQVVMKPEMKEEIKKNLHGWGKEKKAGSTMRRSKKIAVAAVCVLSVGIAAIPVSAKVQSLIRERMEQVPEENIKQIVQNLDAQDAEADSFSRPYSDNENEMFSQMDRAYRLGRFPDGEILQVTDKEQVDADRVCYLTTEAYYYLPERELTEEDILQIIDFQNKLEYGLEERNKEQDDKEAENISRLEENGGISEAEATKAGREWMEKLFSVSTEGMEQNTYLYSSSQEPVTDTPETLKYSNLYMVYFGVMHDYYYFYIDADTGKLAAFEHSKSSSRDQSVAEEDILSAIDQLLPDAEETLKNKLEIEEYDHIYAFYIISEAGENNGGSFSYHFVTEKGDDYVLSYFAASEEWYAYSDTLYPEYIKQQQDNDYKKGEIKQVTIR